MMSGTKEEWKEIQIKNELQVEGLSFDLNVFRELDLGGEIEEAVYTLYAMDRKNHSGVDFPSCFYTPHNYRVAIRWVPSSKYKLLFQDGNFRIVNTDDQSVVMEKLRFAKRPAYFSLKTSDGTDMRSVAEDRGYGKIFTTYSNECCLRDKGLMCKFCNINSTKDSYGEVQNLTWKTPRQIAETVREAYKEGFRSWKICGGFIPERRELEYYLDVADAIIDEVGDEFHGIAQIGAPNDLSVIAKYKDAGYSAIGTNLEVWNEHLFRYVCPGKADLFGGQKNWIETLREEVNVFGKYRVLTSFVAGLEDKASLLDGEEKMIEMGVIPLPIQWNSNAGAEFEGQRTPEPEWHWEVIDRTTDLWIKYGVSWEDIYEANAQVDRALHDLYRWKKGILIDDEGRVIEGNGK